MSRETFSVACSDGGGSGGGSEFVKINTTYLRELNDFLADLETSVKSYSVMVNKEKEAFDTMAVHYVTKYTNNHTKYLSQEKGESDESFKRRKNNSYEMAKKWVEEKKKKIDDLYSQLAKSEKLKNLLTYVSTASSVFTNVAAYQAEFDSEEADLNYSGYFKGAVKTAEAHGWLVGKYLDDEATSGYVEDGQMFFFDEEGNVRSAEEMIRAGYTILEMDGGFAVIAASGAVLQGYTEEEMHALLEAAMNYSKNLTKTAMDEGLMGLGNDKDKLDDAYRQTLGRDYDPEEVKDRNKAALIAAGIDPDFVNLALGNGTNGVFGAGNVSAALPVVAAALPTVVSQSFSGLSAEMSRDFADKLSISPITGKTNEEILNNLAAKANTNGDNIQKVSVRTSESTPEHIEKVTTSSPEVKLTKVSSTPVNPPLPGGTKVSSYTPQEQPKVIEQQATDQYFSRSAAEIEIERTKLLQQTEDAYNGIGVDEFKEALAKGGYSAEDIDYIMEHKEVGFTALVTATQASTIADISKNIAVQQGITGMEFDKNLSAMSLYNGQAQASLGAEQDPDVTKARTAVSRARANYQQKVDDANSLIEKANTSKQELDATKEKIIKRSGEDSSKWTEEDIKEYNEAVEKYNDANKAANDAVKEADGAKDEYNQSEADYKEIYDAKYEEYLKEAQEGIKAAQEAQQQEGADVPQEVGEQGAEIPGEGYDGGDQSILSTLSSGEEGLNLGDGEQALGATVTTPQPVSESQVSYDGSDSSILSGLNLGGDGMSIGTPDMEVSVSVEPPVSPQVQSVPSSSQNIEVPGVNNVQVNETAFTDERVLPDLGLSIDMNTITGGSKTPSIPIGGAVDGVTAFSVPTTDADAAILNGLNFSEGGMSSGETVAPVPQIETPAINTMVSPEFDQALKSELTMDDVDTAVKESSSNRKIDISKFVEPPSSTEEAVQGITRQPSTKTEVENGIVIEIGEDGSLRL